MATPEAAACDYMALYEGWAERPGCVWKPLFVRKASDSFVDTMRFKLSAVSMLSDDWSTCTSDAGKLLCSYPCNGPIKN